MQFMSYAHFRLPYFRTELSRPPICDRLYSRVDIFYSIERVRGDLSAPNKVLSGTYFGTLLKTTKFGNAAYASRRCVRSPKWGPLRPRHGSSNVTGASTHAHTVWNENVHSVRKTKVKMMRVFVTFLNHSDMWTLTWTHGTHGKIPKKTNHGKMVKRKVTQASSVVTDHSTSWAHSCLTSACRWERVYSRGYEPCILIWPLSWYIITTCVAVGR